MSPEDLRGFEELLHRDGASLLRAACLLAGGREEGQDLLQSVLERTFVRWPAIRRENPAAYVRRALVHAVIDGRRRRRARLVDLDEAADIPAVGSPDTIVTGDRDALLAALRGIPARRRAVLVLRYYEDLSEADIAAELGISVGTVKSTASRGLNDLRALLDRAAFDETGKP